MRSIIVILISLAAATCMPRSPVPHDPDHPANPAAAAAPPAPSPRTTEAGDHGGHDHGGHDHGGHDHGEHEAPPSPAQAELAAYHAAKPVFDRYCADCHTTPKSGKTTEALHHFSMDAYPFGGHHAHEMGAVIRKALGVVGGKATMPKDDPGSLTADDLALIVAWTEAYDRARAAAPADSHGGHDHGGHDHSKPAPKKPAPKKPAPKKPAPEKPAGHDHHNHEH